MSIHDEKVVTSSSHQTEGTAERLSEPPVHKALLDSDSSQTQSAGAMLHVGVGMGGGVIAGPKDNDVMMVVVTV